MTMSSTSDAARHDRDVSLRAVRIERGAPPPRARAVGVPGAIAIRAPLLFAGAVGRRRGRRQRIDQVAAPAGRAHVRRWIPGPLRQCVPAARGARNAGDVLRGAIGADRPARPRRQQGAVHPRGGGRSRVACRHDRARDRGVPRRRRRHGLGVSRAVVGTVSRGRPTRGLRQANAPARPAGQGPATARGRAVRASRHERRSGIRRRVVPDRRRGARDARGWHGIRRPRRSTRPADRARRRGAGA